MKYLLAAIIGAALWRIGGYYAKWVRRYILPVVITVWQLWDKKKWKLIYLLPLLVGAFSLGYGEKHPYWEKFLTTTAWVIPCFIFIGFNWLAVIIPPAFLLLFYLSNNPKTSSIFKWHIVEIITGALIGVCYVI